MSVFVQTLLIALWGLTVDRRLSLPRGRFPISGLRLPSLRLTQRCQVASQICFVY